MIEFNGYKYSTESFRGYNLRVVLEVEIKGILSEITFYTDNKDSDKAWSDLLEIIGDKPKHKRLVFIRTKEKDDMYHSFIMDIKEMRG